MQVTNKETKSTFTLTAYQNGKPIYEFTLDRTKAILGRGEKSDFKVEDTRLSFYHAFVEIVPGGVRILDLSSVNGTFLNGEKVDSCFLSAGDRVNFGGLEFIIAEQIQETITEIIDEDHNKVVEVNQEVIVEKAPELTPKSGLTVIDGEYCDITFNEENYKKTKSIKAYSERINSKEYIDAYDKKPIEPIIQKDKGSKSIRVTVLTMGNIVSIDYIPVKGNKTIFMSSDHSNDSTLLIPTLFSEERLPFIKVTKEGIKLYKPAKHQFFDLKENKSVKVYDNGEIPYKLNDEISFTMGSVEIRIETVDSPPRIKGSPFFQQDRNLQKESAKVFSAVFAFLLIMMFVNVEQPQEEKKISVIYRPKVKKQEAKEAKFSKEVAKKEEEVGQKKVEQEKPIDEPKMAKKVMKPVKAEKAKSQKVEKKMANKKATKLPKPSKKVAKKPVKTYKLKLDRSISSFLTKKTNVQVADVNKAATMKNMGTNKLKVSSAKISTKSNINLGTFGKDYKGNVSQSTGTKGLSRKRGFDTAYIEPKTVVLGSMDPELLRKILREYLPQFRHCYQKELEHHSNEISGVIDLRFRINGGGKATKVNIQTQNAQFSAKGTGCMASVLKLIDFPKPKGGGVVDVRQPLNFFSEKGKI